MVPSSVTSYQVLGPSVIRNIDHELVREALFRLKMDPGTSVILKGRGVVNKNAC